MNAVVKEEKALQPWQSAIQGARENFEQNANLVKYDKEKIFAMQALMKTDFAMKIANSNPTSVKLAMINVASTGLTLNPAHGYAYLVPRDNAIHLDISYKGLIKIATDTGAIRWARAEMVRERDSFVYHGPAREPEHQADAFRDRGEIIGVYCIAKTSDGDMLTEIMPLDELEKIRSKSMAFAKSGSGPWKEWFEQMAKKSVIKRASKTWPYTDRGDRLAHAIEVANASEGGYEFDDGNEKPQKVGRPQDGCRMEDMPEDRRPELLAIAAKILQLADSGKINEALAEYEGADIEHEESIAVWGTLPSRHRTAMTRLSRAAK